MKIALDMIQEEMRLREASPAQVEALRRSMADVGLLNPITVYRRKVIKGANWVDGYGLVAGLHRLTAARELGWTEIEATTVTLDDLERQIAECDENLVGPHLSATDRARFTKRRKQAYEALHPEVRHGATLRQGPALPSRQLGETEPATRFTTATAAATGVSERTVQRDAERGELVSDGALKLVKGTPLDTGEYLDKLKKLPASEQVKAVARDVVAVKKVEREAGPALKAKVRFKRQLEALRTQWDKSPEDVRTAFKKGVGLVAIVRPTKSLKPGQPSPAIK